MAELEHGQADERHDQADQPRPRDRRLCWGRTRPGPRHTERRRDRRERHAYRHDELGRAGTERRGGHRPGTEQRSGHDVERGEPGDPLGPQPRLPLREDRLGHGDRRRDAPHDMEGEHEDRPRQPDAESRQVAEGELVQPEVVRVEQGLREEPLLDDPEGEGQQQHRRPSAPAAASHLTDDHRRRPVVGDVEHQLGDLPRRRAAGEVLVPEEELRKARTRASGPCGSTP